MFKTHVFPEYAYACSEEQRNGRSELHPVVIVGAGPVGLAALLDCVRRGLKAVLIDDNNTVSLGSRAVCYAKRTLEVLDRLGVGEQLVEQGVRWNVGKVFHREGLAYQFDLLPEPQHKMPAMVNLQQYHLEEAMVEACARAGADLRWKHKLVGLVQHEDHVALAVQTPDGEFTMRAQWVIACDGANSDTRRLLGAEFAGQRFDDRFLIADVVMEAKFPAERWFWFDPPFHRHQSALLHKQADNVWRIDFQLGRDADPVEEKKPEKVIPRIRAMLGPDATFELEWVSVYQFACRRIDRFRHGRVLFAGDAAHQVSPFGARGANSGIQDVDNLVWKLQAVIEGRAGEALLDSYHDERSLAADDNIAHSTRSTDFITPKSRASLRLRNAVLELAQTEAFARPLVNSGRLSRPTPYVGSPLNTADDEPQWHAAPSPGSDCPDAPVQSRGGPSWLLNHLGEGFTLLAFGEPPAELPEGVRLLLVGRDIVDEHGVLARRYDARPGSCYLIRPDQYVAARWRSCRRADVEAALRKATCR